MLAADTIDALVTPPTDETPACFWTPTDSQVAVCPVDTTVTDPVAVPSIATDPVPLMYSVLDTNTVLPIFVVDPTGGSDGTGLSMDGMTQGTGDSSVDSGVSDGSADGSAAGATDSGNGLPTDPMVDTTQGTDAPSADTSSNDGIETGVTDAGVGQGLVLDYVIPVDRPWWEIRDLAEVPMVEDFVGLGVAQPAVESPAVDLSTSPVVAFAGSDQTAAAISPESRAAAFSTVPVTAQPSVASMYAAFAAGFSQSGSDGQGSSAFAGAKRSARR